MEAQALIDERKEEYEKKREAERKRAEEKNRLVLSAGLTEHRIKNDITVADRGVVTLQV